MSTERQHNNPSRPQQATPHNPAYQNPGEQKPRGPNTPQPTQKPKGR